jgi:hypothetical protein
VSEYEDLMDEQSRTIQQMMHSEFPSNRYPFAMRKIVTNIVKLVMDLNGVCYTESQFDLLWKDVSIFSFKTAVKLLKSYNEAMDKTFGVKR